MIKSILRVSLALGLVMVLSTSAALAQRAAPGGKNAKTDAKKEATTDKAAEPAKALTKAEQANRMYADATSLWQTGRGGEAAAMFESLVKKYQTSERVPQALAYAAVYYAASGQQAKSDQMMALLKKNFDKCQYTMTVYWMPIEAFMLERPAVTPPAKRIELLEEFLDRYWFQAHFGEAIQALSSALVEAGEIDKADLLLTQALSETAPQEMTGMINLIQRGIGNRKDLDSLAKVWSEAAKNMDPRQPATIVVRMLAARCQLAAKKYDVALAGAEQVIKERPKSEYAAYCALELKPAILAESGKPAEAAKALVEAIETFSIFALPRHKEKQAEYEAAAGNLGDAVGIVTALLGEARWPQKKHDLLNLRHDYQLKNNDVDGANATNNELATMFPETRVAAGAKLRSVANLSKAKRFDEAKAALLKVFETWPNSAAVCTMAAGHIAAFDAEKLADDAKALRAALIAAYPASAEANANRKVLEQPLDKNPTAEADALLKEYQSYAQENNIEAARRRIERLYAEFPSSGHGAAATAELSDALKKAGKVDLAAELNLLLAEKAPYHPRAELRLLEGAQGYNGINKPDLAFPGYEKLIKMFRYSDSWPSYVQAGAATLDMQAKQAEARVLVEAESKAIGGGPEGATLEAQQATRLEAQKKWAEAADEMARILGNNAASPAYRPLTGRLFMYTVCAGLETKEDKWLMAETKLLGDLAAKYEGWDEADRLRISEAAAWARARQMSKGVKMLEEIAKRHPKYEIGASGHDYVRYLGMYSRGLFAGTVGFVPMDRVGYEMGGGHDNYLYAHTTEDMIDYCMLLNEPQGYVDRIKKRLGALIKAPPPKRPNNYKAGLPYKTANVVKPQPQPLPEQRLIYQMVDLIDQGLRQKTERVDAALWLDVYPLWPNHYLNDERMTSAACALYGRDKDLFQKAYAILQANYNELTWLPNVLNAQGQYERNNGSKSEAQNAFGTVAKKYPDHSLAAAALQAYKECGGK